MTHRDRKLLDVAHDAPCFLLLGAPGCGNHLSVPCHSDALEHGRGAGHKSHDCLAVPGCPACHSIFDRAHLGREGYLHAHAQALARYTVWLWETGRLKLIRRPVTPVMIDLSTSQRACLDFIGKFIDKEGISPTGREIADGLKFRSPNAAYELLAALESKGAITMKAGRSRSIRLVEA